jgi:hypothetical protein
MGSSDKGGLESSDWFLVVISPNSVKAEWVDIETKWAFDHRRQSLASG